MEKDSALGKNELVSGEVSLTKAVRTVPCCGSLADLRACIKRQADPNYVEEELVGEWPFNPLPRTESEERYEMWEAERKAYISEKLDNYPNKRFMGDDGYMILRARQFSDEWDAVFGPNRDHICVEQHFRKPGVALKPWQRMRDYRQALNAEVFPVFERQKQEKLKKIRAGNRERKRIQRDKADPRTLLQKEVDRDAKKLLNYQKKLERNAENKRKKRAPQGKLAPAAALEEREK